MFTTLLAIIGGITLVIGIASIISMLVGPIVGTVAAIMLGVSAALMIREDSKK